MLSTADVSAQEAAMVTTFIRRAAVPTAVER
jgi:hypothetical protein